MYQITKHKFLNPEEYARFEISLANAPTRDQAIFGLMMATGGRPSEILNITKADMNTHEQRVHIRGLKNSFDRELPIPPKLFALIEDMAKDLRPNDPIFHTGLRLLQLRWSILRPNQNLGVRSLRHTFAIRLYAKTKDIQLVQRVLGHKSILNTMVYAHYFYSQEEFKKLLIG